MSEIPERAGGDRGYDIEFREWTIRVEEELKHQREWMFEGFKQMEKRFEQVDRRFEQIDKHLAQFTTRMDRFIFWSLGPTVSAVIAVVKFM